MTGENISDRIKCIRGKIGYSQKQMCDYLNVSQSNYAKIEKGNLNPSLEFMGLLSSKFGINLNWLIMGEGNMYLKNGNLNKEQAINAILKGKSINEDILRIIDSLNDKLLVNEMIKAIMLAESDPAFKNYFLKRKMEKEGGMVMVGGEKS
ncbi:MAG: helix-turn-helix transcriptional regulator [Candidatus Aminicenantes bacterium]|jgi:transcriptional regulator with XRE-family HTH domain